MAKILTLSYIAGLFDGEGNVGFMCTLKARTPGSIRCRLGMKSELLPRLLQVQFGGRVTKFKNGVFQWDVAAQQAVAFLNGILPYLILKHSQAVLAIEYQGKLDGHRLTEDEIVGRVEDYLRMQQLNRANYA